MTVIAVDLRSEVALRVLQLLERWHTTKDAQCSKCEHYKNQSDGTHHADPHQLYDILLRFKKVLHQSFIAFIQNAKV
jgi:hypothetical protein